MHPEKDGGNTTVFLWLHHLIAIMMFFRRGLFIGHDNTTTVLMLKTVMVITAKIMQARWVLRNRYWYNSLWGRTHRACCSIC